MSEVLEEQRHQQRDADHRDEGGDEGDLGDHRCVLAVFQTEDGAVGGHRHGDDQRIDVHHKRIEAYEPHQEMHAHRQQRQAQQRGGIDGAIAEHGAQRQLRHRRADDEQGGGDGDVAQHRQHILQR